MVRNRMLQNGVTTERSSFTTTHYSNTSSSDSNSDSNSNSNSTISDSYSRDGNTSSGGLRSGFSRLLLKSSSDRDDVGADDSSGSGSLSKTFNGRGWRSVKSLQPSLPSPPPSSSSSLSSASTTSGSPFAHGSGWRSQTAKVMRAKTGALGVRGGGGGGNAEGGGGEVGIQTRAIQDMASGMGKNRVRYQTSEGSLLKYRPRLSKRPADPTGLFGSQEDQPDFSSKAGKESTSIGTNTDAYYYEQTQANVSAKLDEARHIQHNATADTINSTQSESLSSLSSISSSPNNSSSSATAYSAVDHNKTYPTPSSSASPSSLLYDALQSGNSSNQLHTEHSPFSSSAISTSPSSLVSSSSNHTSPASSINPFTHSYRGHVHSVSLSSSSPFSSPAPSQQSHIGGLSSSSSTSSLPSSSPTSAIFSSSLSSAYSPLDPSQPPQSSSKDLHPRNFLKHIGLGSNTSSSSSYTQLSAKSLSSSSSSSSSSISSKSFIERLREAGLSSLNLQYDLSNSPTLESPSDSNFTFDLRFNETFDCFFDEACNLQNVTSSTARSVPISTGGDEAVTSADGFEPVVYKYWTILLVVFPLLTVFGNVLVCMSVVKEKSLKTVTNYFICSLAVADIMVAVVVMPFAVYMEVSTNTFLKA
ncbi:D(2) dopamine receptor [Plakobranchus ocellatus]|uniref:D(2) dopamine receptor n=1 Tax=Plakobranchus ocellatus TaxID=259542 RepID=A0AAV4BVG0_9GAST|nr:D(2) dopamine receptor [Plakobranchus ocellatus]